MSATLWFGTLSVVAFLLIAAAKPGKSIFDK